MITEFTAVNLSFPPIAAMCLSIISSTVWAETIPFPRKKKQIKARNLF